MPEGGSVDQCNTTRGNLEGPVESRGEMEDKVDAGNADETGVWAL